MIKYPEKIEQWLLLYLQGCLNEEQKQELEAWAKESPANKEVLRKLQEKHWQEGVRQIAYFDQQQNWPKVVRQIARHRRIVWMRRISVAACIAVLLGTSYLLLTPESTPAPPATITRVQPHEVTLSTASGKSYSLDSVGRITTEGTLLKSNGEKLQFKPRQETAVQIEWNTVKVPRGATYKVELSDQTEVTLNAESVLYFPNRFEEGKNREIWLAGEAFFNVTKDSLHPFIVHANDINVKVLGTKFNLKAYDEATEQQITLVQGKVEVENEQMASKIILSPGEQATFNPQRHTLESQKVDTSYYTAWLDDLFAFRETPFSEVMRTLAQWYDFEFFFQNQEIQDFIYTGKIKRYDTLNEVLENFRKTGDLEFTINKSVVIVRKATKH